MTDDDEKTKFQFDAATTRHLFADVQHWYVREVPAPAFDRRQATHLMFWSETTMRRVRVFPANWRELSDEALYQVCEHVKRAE